MGIYKAGVKEIVEAMAKALDDIEGDFGIKDLKQAFKIMKHYPYVSDVDMDYDSWQDYIADEINANMLCRGNSEDKA